MKALKLVVGLAIAGAAASAGFVYSGAYDMAADEPHWTVTEKLLEALRERSVAMRIRDIEVPADLGDAARVRRGAGNYDAMCAGCHLRPGLDDSEIRKGLYPQPPRLAESDRDAGSMSGSAARQFWIIKHGIKASGMPAWSKGGVDDATIWDMVAWLQKLPELSPEDYAAAVAASEGHTHAGAHHEHEDGHEDGHERMR
jgi:mono/diheme cytochrome c family protein